MPKLKTGDHFPAVDLRNIDGVTVVFPPRSRKPRPLGSFFTAADGDPGAGPR
jgi:hypothetical protein